jgi:glycosyltransferase involved in cell wall biosynthesis
MPRVFHRAEKQIGQFDIVHSNVYADFLLPKRAASGIRVVTVYHMGSTAATSAGVRLPSRLLMLSSEYGPAVIAEGVCLKRADHIIAISNFTRNDILKRYPDTASEQVSVIYPGTRREPRLASAVERARLRTGWGIASKERIALAVGRLENRKGIPFLLHAFSQVHSAGNLKLVLVGSGPTEAAKAIARRLGIADRVVFAGYVDDSTLSIAYRIADVFVHAASLEGFGLSVADAVAVGLPVVATRVGSIPEIVVEGVDGYLVNYGNTLAFAERIEEALEPASPLRHADRGVGPKCFAWKKTAGETLSRYEQLISTRSDRKRNDCG